MRGVIALGAAVMTIVLSGCAEPPGAPTLDAVADERSLTMSLAWVRFATATDEYIREDWPEAVYPTLEFERWIDEDAVQVEHSACMDRLLGRRSGSISSSGVFVLAPRPTKEPTWALPVAQLRCSVQLVPWSGSYPLGGPVEQAWVRHQVTVALPNCVRRFGAELVIADVDAAVDASIFVTSADGVEVPTQSVWLAAELRNADSATAQQIRAVCPDPGRTIAQLGPAEITPLEFGPSGGGRGGAAVQP